MYRSVDRTDIHLGFAPSLGNAGIQCTLTQVYLYSYDKKQLFPIEWDHVKRIRFTANLSEVKFTIKIRSNVEKYLRIQLSSCQAMVEQLIRLGAITKVPSKWLNLNGSIYFKPSCMCGSSEFNATLKKVISEPFVTEQDFQDHIKIDVIAQAVPIYKPKGTKSSFCDQMATILDNLF